MLIQWLHCPSTESKDEQFAHRFVCLFFSIFTSRETKNIDNTNNIWHEFWKEARERKNRFKAEWWIRCCYCRRRRRRCSNNDFLAAGLASAFGVVGPLAASNRREATTSSNQVGFRRDAAHSPDLDLWRWARKVRTKRPDFQRKPPPPRKVGGCPANAVWWREEPNSGPSRGRGPSRWTVGPAPGPREVRLVGAQDFVPNGSIPTGRNASLPSVSEVPRRDPPTLDAFPRLSAALPRAPDRRNLPTRFVPSGSVVYTFPTIMSEGERPKQDAQRPIRASNYLDLSQRSLMANIRLLHFDCSKWKLHVHHKETISGRPIHLFFKKYGDELICKLDFPEWNDLDNFD